MNMFKDTEAATPEQYIAAIPEPRRQDIAAIDDLIRTAMPSGTAVYMQSGMIGYGSYHYKYSSGREGDWAIIGLSSRKDYISVYIMCTVDGKYLAETYKDKLPKANIGKSCVRFQYLSDVDTAILSEMVTRAFELTP